MKTPEKPTFPKGLFAILAIGGLLASGIYLGIMSVNGVTGINLASAVGFGLLGLLMLWGALSRPGG